MNELSDDRTLRTQQELDAGLREKITAMRKAAHLADELLREIEATVKKKRLDRIMVYQAVPAYPEENCI